MTTTFTEGVLSSLAPLIESNVTADLENYLIALCACFETVYGIVSDQGVPNEPATYIPGWSSLLNIDTCPTEFLPYLGSFLGTYVPPNTADATARQVIEDECGFNRGTKSAVTFKTEHNLAGSKSVFVIERLSPTGPDPYHFIVLVRPEQVISVDSLIAAVNAVKPGGVQWTLVQTDGITWAAETHTWANDTLTWAQKG